MVHALADTPTPVHRSRIPLHGRRVAMMFGNPFMQVPILPRLSAQGVTVSILRGMDT